MTLWDLPCFRKPSHKSFVSKFPFQISMLRIKFHLIRGKKKKCFFLCAFVLQLVYLPG